MMEWAQCYSAIYLIQKRVIHFLYELFCYRLLKLNLKLPVVADLVLKLVIITIKTVSYEKNYQVN